MADQSPPVLEQIQFTPLLDKSFTSTHSSPGSSVPETQVVVGNNIDFCPELRKDLDLVHHVLVQATDDDNTKKQKKAHVMELVPATQIVVGNNREICHVLQKDSNLVRHVLVQQPDDENVSFIQYLTKKQKKALSRNNIHSKGAPPL